MHPVQEPSSTRARGFTNLINHLINEFTDSIPEPQNRINLLRNLLRTQHPTNPPLRPPRTHLINLHTRRMPPRQPPHKPLDPLHNSLRIRHLSLRHRSIQIRHTHLREFIPCLAEEGGNKVGAAKSSGDEGPDAFAVEEEVGMGSDVGEDGSVAHFDEG